MNTVHNLRNEIISAVPYLLGHRPHEAVVVLAIRDNVLASAVAHGLGDTFALTARAMRRHYIRSSILIGYSNGDSLPGPMAQAYRQLNDESIDVIDYLIVCHGRWVGRHDDTKDGYAIPGPGDLVTKLTADGYTTGHNTGIDPASLSARREVSRHLNTVTGYVDDFSSSIRKHARQLIGNADTRPHPGFADTAILIAAAWDPSIAQHAMACIHAASEPGSHLDLWTWVTRHASGPELAAPAVLAACAAHLCASDTIAVAFARAAMGAAVGWPSALLTNRILRYFTEATTPPRDD